jgi:hypothetical protein
MPPQASPTADHPMRPQAAQATDHPMPAQAAGHGGVGLCLTQQGAFVLGTGNRPCRKLGHSDTFLSR